MFDTAAVVIPDQDIYDGENANVGLQIDPIRGGLVFDSALEKNKTGGVDRGVYASFYYLDSGSLGKVATIDEAPDHHVI
jgi:hypothetical protein